MTPWLLYVLCVSLLLVFWLAPFWYLAYRLNQAQDDVGSLRGELVQARSQIIDRQHEHITISLDAVAVQLSALTKELDERHNAHYASLEQQAEILRELVNTHFDEAHQTRKAMHTELRAVRGGQQAHSVHGPIK